MPKNAIATDLLPGRRRLEPSALPLHPGAFKVASLLGLSCSVNARVGDARWHAFFHRPKAQATALPQEWRALRSRFLMLRFLRRPKGAATNQPRASPGESWETTVQKALKGRNKEASFASIASLTLRWRERKWRWLFCPFRVGSIPFTSHPRALPVAGWFRPLRGMVPTRNIKTRASGW